MARATFPSIVTLRLTSATRWLLLLPAVCALFGCWFIVRWYVGNTVAEYAPSADEGGVEMARMAARWAPGDPFTHWRLATLEQKIFSASNLADAVREFQLAVTLSPNDYRYWMELGRALEASGDTVGGEKALRRAVELAPAYSYPRWYYGNLLLRAGKLDEAFAQLAWAAGADPLMRAPVFNLAWQVFHGDADKIAKAACSTAPVRMEFATYLVRQNKVDEATRLWRTITSADRKANGELTQGFVNVLDQSRRFSALLEVLQQNEPGGDGPVREQFWNGSFERDIEPTKAMTFYWVFGSSAQARVTRDTVAHDGQGSLRIVFTARNKLDAIPVAQTVVVDPGAQYNVEFYVRTENLNSGATPLVSIVDATTNVALVSSPAAPTGTNNWQRITVDFKTEPKCEGVIVNISRGTCGEDQLCPIYGTIWYDDFRLQRVGGSGSPGRAPAPGKR